MKKVAAAVLGILVSLVGHSALAQQPAERIVFDDCQYDNPYDENRRLVCRILVAAPDFSERVAVAEGTDPSVSPDGGRIAFTSFTQDQDILVIDLATGTLTALTSDSAVDGAPTWSPDGTRIAFQSDRAGATQVFVMNADGSGLAQLSLGVLAASRPAWSPDGSHVAFSCQVEADNWDICSAAADGSGLERLTSGPGPDSAPAWSPDGTRIAYTTGSGWSMAAAIMNADGSGSALVGGGDSIVVAYGVAWSPDGSHLAVDAPIFACEQGDYYCYATVGVYTLDGAYTGIGTTGANPVWTGVRPTPGPKARFTALCRVMDCSFDASDSWDLGSAITGYAWDFGDGQTAAGVTADHTYADPGPHVVTLTVTDALGLTGARTDTATTALNQPPTPTFTTACSNTTCDFTASATDSDGWITAWSWDFGDGTTFSSPWGASSYRHVYAAAGTYTATLTVTDDHGATGSVSRLVRAGNTAPMAAFTATCSGFTCSFDASGSSDADGTVVRYQWEFGDGGTAEGATASHAYRDGTYSAYLTVTDNEGAVGRVYHNVTAVNASPVASFTLVCSGLSCTFDGTASSDPDGTIEHAGWNFGDGAVAPGLTATHTYAAAGQYSVALTVTDNGGMSGQRWQTITVNTPPVAAFTASCASVTCSFNASASSDPDGTIASYRWAFGDGASGAGVAPSHAYAAAGTFTVTLTVTDNLGATATTTRSVTAVNAPPVAAFTASCASVTCSFDASGSSDPDGTIATYTWAFGDGTSGAGVTASHVYGAAGTFTVTLTVADNLGAAATTSRTVTAVNAAPLASFASSCLGLGCSFNAAASSDSDGAIASYAWRFGDGATGAGANPSHAYAAAGTFTVTLTVTDNLAATGTASSTVTVTQAHVGDLDGQSSIQGGSWSASVTVAVHTSAHALVAGATVTGSWTGGATGSCTTASTGRCVVTRSGIGGGTRTVTFTVTGVSHPTMTYAPAGNHDPDADSNGTTIAVKR